MYFLLNIYDSSYGDAKSFDEFIFYADDFDALISTVTQRHNQLIDNGTLSVNEQDWGQELVSSEGEVIEANLTVFKTEADANASQNGLMFTNTMFFDPSKSEPLTSGVDPDWLWESLNDEDDELIAYWGLTGFILNKPDELDSSSGGLYELPLLKYFFKQLKNHG